MHRFFFALAWLGAASAQAQLGGTQAQLIVESLLSTQNPLLVVSEIAYDDLLIRPKGRGFEAQIMGPRLPGRPAFSTDLSLTLAPKTRDLVEVFVKDIRTTMTMADGGRLSFRPTYFNGTYSLSRQGFDRLALGLEDLAYDHPVGRFSLEQFDMRLGPLEGVPTLAMTAVGFAADMQDVADYQESVEQLEVRLALANEAATGGDVLVLLNGLFDLLVDSGQEALNQGGKARPLPSDLSGLSLSVSLQDYRPRWMALRDQGPRETMALTTLGNFTLQADLAAPNVGQDLGQDLDQVPSQNLSLIIAGTLSDLSIDAPSGVLDVRVGAANFGLNITGLRRDQTHQLLAKGQGVQTAALSHLIGHMGALQLRGEAQDVRLDSTAEQANFALDDGGFNLNFRSPYTGLPNTKDMGLSLRLNALQLDYPDLVAGYEPAWSTLLQPALPKHLDLRLKIGAIPGAIWRDLFGLFVETRYFPTDEGQAPVMSLTLDGTRYQSDLVGANLDGTLTYAPDADLLAIGDLRLALSDLRPVIAAMQRAARVPDRTLAQFLTFGSVGLAAILGFAEEDADGWKMFSFEFQQSGFPTINGRPLPVGF